MTFRELCMAIFLSGKIRDRDRLREPSLSQVARIRRKCSSWRMKRFVDPNRAWVFEL
jgi:hypothetical protein